ncbi:MAG: glycosyltransferase family 2 protein [Clostridiales bacterium]|nr:glycosyltransferase family 2 protein [Clostridiales bacterium]
MKKNLISIVVPCYNEEKTIEIFMNEITKIEEEMIEGFNTSFEYIFVDDGSEDSTSSIMKDLSQKQANFKYIILSRNFGKEGALFAGLQKATGDYVAVMDVDLQDPPYMLKEMYSTIINDGYDCVGTRRTNRKGEPPIRSLFARMFYKLINKISSTEIVDGARDYRLMTRDMVNAILSMSEYNRFSKGIFSWVGFKTKWLEYTNTERVAGETKWSFWKLFLYSLDGIVAFSTAPLAISSILGLLFCIISFFIIIFIIAKTLIWGDPVAGYPSLVCIIFLIAGVQLFCSGIQGQYIAKTYLETKKRPIYLIKETNINKEG